MRLPGLGRVGWGAVVLLALGAGGARAEDWPQWRGLRRDGVSAEQGWLAGWPEGQAPKVAWRAQVGKGHATVVVVGERAYTAGWDGKQDTVFCLNVENGETVWRQSYTSGTIVQWPGPRATPAVAGGSVYTLGQHGQMHAYDAATGKARWQVRLAEKYMPDADYGFVWSPLVAGEVVILGAGRGLALRTADGAIAWGADSPWGACLAPTPYEAAGRRGVIVGEIAKDRSHLVLVGVDAATGKEQWRSTPWPEKWGAATVDVVNRDGRFFLTTAETHKQCARFVLAGGQAKPDWNNNHLVSYTGGCVLLGDHLYGVDIKKQGQLRCLDWETGEVRWSQPGFGMHGTLIAADGKLLVQTSDKGELVIVEAGGAGYRELRRAKVFRGEPRTFAAPVLANGRVYCRSYAGEVVCLDLR